MGVPMTRDGLRRLEEELAELEAKRPLILKAVQEAREKGDLKENAEYHAAREDLALCESKISLFKQKIGQAEIIDTTKSNGDAIVFGATVKLHNLTDDEEEEFTLVGEGEDDIFSNRILTTSPMGQAMLTKRVGDMVEVDVPMGKMRFKVLEISFG
jgi:transcription elongation factor GreA